MVGIMVGVPEGQIEMVGLRMFPHFTRVGLSSLSTDTFKPFQWKFLTTIISILLFFLIVYRQNEKMYVLQLMANRDDKALNILTESLMESLTDCGN